MTTYNPFALPPRSIKEFLGEPAQYLENPVTKPQVPMTMTKPQVPMTMSKPQVPTTMTKLPTSSMSVKSPTPILYDMSNEKIDPFADGFGRSPITQLPSIESGASPDQNTKTKDYETKNSFIIILIIILTIVFLIIGIGVFMKYYVPAKPKEPDNIEDKKPNPVLSLVPVPVTANQKPT
jgi:hypothetical protein